MSCVLALMAALSCIVVLSAMRFVGSAPSASYSDRDALTAAAAPAVPTRLVTGTGSFSSAEGGAPEKKAPLSVDDIDTPDSVEGLSQSPVTTRHSASSSRIAREPEKESLTSAGKERRLASSPGAIWEEETPSSPPQKQLPSERAREERTMPQVNRALLSGGVSSLGLRVARAEDAPDIPGSSAPNNQESAQFVGGQQAPASSQTQKATARSTVEGFVQAFIAETDPEGKQNLLAAAAEFPGSDGLFMRPLLEQALLAHQPLKVRQQALYLAADMAPELVQKIAADRSHPLQQEAEAFLREAKLSAGRIPPNSDD